MKRIYEVYIHAESRSIHPAGANAPGLPRTSGRRLAAAALLAAALFGNFASAQPREETLRVPVRVQDAYGKTIERAIVVTVWESPGRAPYPLLVLNHGRSASAAGRAKLGRARYSEASAFFAARGYSVWVPTRIGYGESGADEDPEDTGPCNNKRYPPGYTVAADQTLQVIEHARRRADIDP